MRFIVISDTHLSAQPDVETFLWWHKNLVPEAAEICRLAVRDINRIKPDFVVHCGDITNASDDLSMELARDIFGELCCPFYFVPGNHECWEKGARNRMNRLFGLQDADVLYRTVDLGETVLLLIDAAYWESLEAEYKDYLDYQDLVRAMERSGYTGVGGGLCVPDDQLAWIETVLTRTRGKTVLVFLHAGLRGRGVYETSKDENGKPLAEPPMRMDYRYKNSERLIEMLRAAGNVRAVFSGHIHWNECFTENGLVHCHTGSLIQYPCEMRLVRSSESSITGEMIPLSDRAFARRSFVEDSDGAFIAGCPEDRQFHLERR